LVRAPQYEVPSAANITAHTDGRGKVAYLEWTNPDGQRMYTFPGDYPAAEAPDIRSDAFYVVKQYDGENGNAVTTVTLYGKPWDATADDPVWRAVVEGGSFKTFEKVSAHKGNPAYWNVPPEERGELPDDV
jgi:hypothetical protein